MRRKKISRSQIKKKKFFNCLEKLGKLKGGAEERSVI